MAKKKRIVVYHGELEAYFETGTEGVMWSLVEDGKTGYDALVIIEPGDRLTVYGEDGRTPLFDGIVRPDHEIGYRPHFEGAGHGQPCALGLWIHWTQKGWQPDDWARLFARSLLKPEDGGGASYRGKLIRRTKSRK